MDWSNLPDLGCVLLLIYAFASASKRGQTLQSRIWLVGWILIAVHFAASMFVMKPGMIGGLSNWIELSALADAGVIFIWASLPYRQRSSSLWLMTGLLIINTIYVGLIILAPIPSWILDLTAAMYCIIPLGITLLTIQQFQRPERWVTVTLFSTLAVFLLVVQHRTGGPFLAISGILTTVYLVCCIMFWISYQKMTTGSFITVAGFLAWSSVFVLAPVAAHLLPKAHIENETWNLPKYLVAVGMILLMLEDQIAHNRHLALHDELTGLPNRRLFEDRIENALERARRGGCEVALLLIDLNYFKQVNDTAGHHVGDELLKRVSSIFLTRVRLSDTVARTGGDEFSVILEGPVSRQQAEEVGASLKALLSEPIQVAGHTLQIGASIGLAMFPEDARAAEPLYIAADLAMYAEKYKERNPGPDITEQQRWSRPLNN